MTVQAAHTAAQGTQAATQGDAAQPQNNNQMWQIAATVAIIAVASIAIAATCVFAPVVPAIIVGVVVGTAAIAAITSAWTCFSSGNDIVVVNGHAPRDRVVVVDSNPWWRWPAAPVFVPAPAVRPAWNWGWGHTPHHTPVPARAPVLPVRGAPIGGAHVPVGRGHSPHHAGAIPPAARGAAHVGVGRGHIFR